MKENSLTHYTSIEQSKKLLELGLSPQSADCMWEQHNIESPYITVKPHTTLGRSIGAHAIPCWSLGALLEVIPNSIQEQQINIKKNQNQISYGCWTDSGSWSDMISTPECESLTEAAYYMVVWLLENNYIKTEKK